MKFSGVMKPQNVALLAIIAAIIIMKCRRSAYKFDSDVNYFRNMGSIDYIKGARYMPSVQSVMYADPEPQPDEPILVPRRPSYSPGAGDVRFNPIHYGKSVQDSMYRRSRTGSLGPLAFYYM